VEGPAGPAGRLTVLLKNDSALLPLGSFCLVAAILLGRFVHGVPYMDFLEGVLIGASLVFNLAYLVRLRSKRNRSGD
jgi:hypothetical protein